MPIRIISSSVPTERIQEVDMSHPNDPQEDRDQAPREVGELLLLYALQAADYGLIAEFWAGNREQEMAVNKPS